MKIALYHTHDTNTDIILKHSEFFDNEQNMTRITEPLEVEFKMLRPVSNFQKRVISIRLGKSVITPYACASYLSKKYGIYISAFQQGDSWYVTNKFDPTIVNLTGK